MPTYFPRRFSSSSVSSCHFPSRSGMRSGIFRRGSRSSLVCTCLVFTPMLRSDSLMKKPRRISLRLPICLPPEGDAAHLTTTVSSLPYRSMTSSAIESAQNTLYAMFSNSNISSYKSFSGGRLHEDERVAVQVCHECFRGEGVFYRRADGLHAFFG